MRLLRAGMAAGAFALALAGAGAAQAGTSWTVGLGEQSPAPKTAPKGATLNEFLPDKLTIAAGDSVTFSSAGFHMVAYLKGARPALFVPDPKKSTYAGIKDSAGADFWFNGQPKFVYNGAAFAPIGGTTIDGSAPLVSSGVLAPRGPKQRFASATFSFPKAGTYHLICTVHPSMEMDVTVKAAGSTLPLTPTQVKAEVLKEQAAGFAEITKLAAATKPAPATVDAGIGDGATALAFFPKVVTVKAGTTVVFANKSPREVHNVVLGPAKWIAKFSKTTDLLPTGPTAPNQVTPVYLYGSEPKGKYQYDGKNHGNGFLATPLTFSGKGVPLPPSAAVTFTTPGTYRYFCLIHGPDMSGTVIVTK